ncbi:receptor-like protein kinase FERONIA [Camellia sinensis]|uniref:receptor-like protein kinase FERONIA n=1 Tax=Camellia sinensis TaxID=4442 RepID=UPI001036CD2B|nr:receptor-like protein kinase FERONIA [Camellia sinensis]
MKVKNGLNRYPFLSMIMFLALMHIGHLTVPIWANRSPYTPTDYFLFECLASTAATLLSNGQKWSPNNNSNFEYYPYYEVSKASQISGDPKSPQSLYACIVRKQSSFTFAVSSIGMHFIRLHFYPTSYEGLNMSKALFSVSVANYTLLRTSESPYSSNPSDAIYIIKEFCINVDDLVINITFTPSRNSSGAYGFVNKIEIVSMPQDIYYVKCWRAFNLVINVAFTPSRNSSGAYGFVNKIEIVSMPQDIYYVRRGDDQLPFIGHHSKFFTGNSIALEMMYRLNVGGHSIYAEDDTGMLRAWSEDFSFLINQITDTIHPKVNIKYSLSVPAYIAPQQIYATARTMEDNGHCNMTWLFPLEGSFYYLVRLHFCEVMKDIWQDNQRVFQVYLNDQIVENYADVIHWSGGVGVPVYRDYIVNVTRNSQEMFLSLALKSTESLNGAILNSLEIFKLSDHAYNLAGPFPFGQRTHPFGMSNRLLQNHPKIVFIPFYTLVALTFLCYIFLLFLIRWFPFHSNLQRRTFKLASSDHCRYFTLVEIKSATNNSSDANVIGAGGFGKVYKGYIDGSIAIKRGSPTSHQGLHEFHTEITILTKLKHNNLVSLIGYCVDEKEMILVYEFTA